MGILLGGSPMGISFSSGFGIASGSRLLLRLTRLSEECFKGLLVLVLTVTVSLVVV